MRPFATARLRGDAGDDLGDDWEFAVDVGGGAELAWPAQGLALRVRGTAQLNEGAGHREHRVVVQLSYDLAGDGRGLTVAAESGLAGRERLGGDREDGSAAAGGVADALAHSSLGSAYGAFVGSRGSGSSLDGLTRGASDIAAGPGAGGLGPRLRGEIGYGVAGLSFGTLGTPELLTPYARFHLGRASQRYGAGLRLQSQGGGRLGVEGAVDFDRGAGAAPAAPDYQLLLTGELVF